MQGIGVAKQRPLTEPILQKNQQKRRRKCTVRVADKLNYVKLISVKHA